MIGYVTLDKGHELQMKSTGTSALTAKNGNGNSAIHRIIRWFMHGITWRINASTRIKKLLGPVAMERLIFYHVHGYFPHLRHPHTFNEKICNRKLFTPIPQASILADKVAVRKFVAERGYEDILNEILMVTTRPEEIDFSKLPQRFVIKASHGSGWDIIVRNKEEIVPEEIVDKCQEWMKSVYGESLRESHYRDIPPAIIVEKFLFDTQYEVPLDYKMHVFHGKCHFIQVDYGRFSEHTRTIYDRNWEPQDFTFTYPRKIVDTKRPATLGRMLEIAEALARDMDYCRVDLYSVNDHDVYFGEMTLTPAGGYELFGMNAKGDYLMGSYW
jgi:hypothetical protein